MARACQLTGRKTVVGNNVSHANNRTKRNFYPNLKTKRFWLAEEERFVTLKVSTAAIRNITKNGLFAEIKKAQAAGLLGAI